MDSSSTENRPRGVATVPVERVSHLPRDLARWRLFAPARPVIVTGAMDDWPARGRWNLEDLQSRFGTRTVLVAPTKNRTVVSDTRAGIPYREMVFGDYLELLRGGGDPGCYLIFRVHEQLPELLDDIVLPACCRDAPWFLSRFWLSAPRVGSPLHFDLPENLYAQVSGRKRFLLFAPTQSRRLYRHPWYSGLPNFSRVDPEVPDYASYPRFRGARAHEAVLEPGEFLYIPSRWWHQARALDVSISANLWWARGPLHAAIRAAEVFARVRGLKL